MLVEDNGDGEWRSSRVELVEYQSFQILIVCEKAHIYDDKVKTMALENSSAFQT